MMVGTAAGAAAGAVAGAQGTFQNDDSDGYYGASKGPGNPYGTQNSTDYSQPYDVNAPPVGAGGYEPAPQDWVDDEVPF